MHALRKPMTGAELLAAMCDGCPSVQLRDIWRSLKKLEARHLVYCLTPNEITGRLYFFTDKGRRFVKQELGTPVEPLPGRVNWQTYSQVVRGQVRSSVLKAMEKRWMTRDDKTIADVRRLLFQQNRSLCMSAVIRAFHELENLRLIRRVGVTEKRDRPLYRLTAAGRRILRQLKHKPGPSPGLPNASSSNLI